MHQLLLPFTKAFYSVRVLVEFEVVYKRRAPAPTPTMPAAEPASLKLVAIAAPGEVEEEAAAPPVAPPPFVASATWMP